MPETTRILFVCVGNICRSPTAEAVFRLQAEKAGWGNMFTVESAGVIALHAGEPPDPRSQKHAVGRGYDLSALRARQIDTADFEKFDLILAMEKSVLESVRELQSLVHKSKADTGLFLDYLPDYEGQDVPDPYYGAADGFETVLDLVEAGSHALLRSLLQKQGVFGCGC